MTKTRQEIERIIEGFLREHGENYMTCALATCAGNQARCTPVDARADGLTMYFVCDRGGKLENIKKNPQVCLAVFIPVGRGYMKNARGLQMWGTAHILTMKDEPAGFARGADIIRIDEISVSLTGAALPGAVKETLTIIKIIPEKIAYFDSTGPEPVRYVWENQQL
jgi:general stress protein 26